MVQEPLCSHSLDHSLFRIGSVRTTRQAVQSLGKGANGQGHLELILETGDEGRFKVEMGQVEDEQVGVGMVSLQNDSTDYLVDVLELSQPGQRQPLLPLQTPLHLLEQTLLLHQESKHPRIQPEVFDFPNLSAQLLYDHPFLQSNTGQAESLDINLSLGILAGL